MSMRKHKLSTASLFEQRRRKPQSSTKDTIKYSSLPNNNNNNNNHNKNGMKDSSSDVFPDSDTIISGVTTDV